MFRMNIKPLKVTVREVVDGYVDDSDREEGIYGYGGRLNIRPKYQRNYIYEYIFDGRQSHLNLRQFEDWQKQTMYERQKGRCPECVKEGVKRMYDISEMHADHVKPWHLGGKTEIENGRMLCAAHNLAKGGVW